MGSRGDGRMSCACRTVVRQGADGGQFVCRCGEWVPVAYCCWQLGGTGLPVTFCLWGGAGLPGAGGGPRSAARPRRDARCSPACKVPAARDARCSPACKVPAARDARCSPAAPATLTRTHAPRTRTRTGRADCGEEREARFPSFPARPARGNVRWMGQLTTGHVGTSRGHGSWPIGNPARIPCRMPA